MAGALRRALGTALVLLSFAPLYRLLDAEDDALRQASVDVASTTLAFLQTGAATVALVSVLLAFVLPRSRLLPALEGAGRRIAAISIGRWALGVGGLALLLAAVSNVVLYRGFYTNIDEISSFIHARYLAAGRLAGPLPGPPEGWLIPNMLVVDAGWVSQFPPSHLVALAGGAAAGLAWLVGPVLFAAMAAMATLSFARLLPEHGRAVRVAGVLVAASPFLVFLGAGGWSHASAGAFLWLALYAALRARDGGWAWSVLAGAAIGVAVCSRPWVSLLLGTIATLGAWLPHVAPLGGRSPGSPAWRLDGMGWLARRAAGTLLGGAPFAIALGWYSQVLFGAPTRLGYEAAFGARHRLGFHADPWGNLYTPLDALALTSGDVIVFGAQLLESPLPVGAVIGLWLILTRVLPTGGRLLVAWALVPIAGNALYWFHSTRMMYEAAPAWLALAAVATAPLFTPDAAATPSPTAARRRIEPAGVGVWATLVTLAMAVGLGVPQRAGSFTWDEETLARLTVPDPPDGRPALVFVHASWNERLSARLQGSGAMRQDSVISLLRRNTNCALDAYARIRGDGTLPDTEPQPQVDLTQLPGTPESIVRPAVADGTTLRTREGERFSPACQRELNADRFGAVALAPLLWQGDLPGIEEGRPLFVRDLGPEANSALVEGYAERTPWVFVPKQPGAPPELVPYAEAMAVLWGVDRIDN